MKHEPEQWPMVDLANSVLRTVAHASHTERLPGCPYLPPGATTHAYERWAGLTGKPEDPRCLEADEEAELLKEGK